MPAENNPLASSPEPGFAAYIGIDWSDQEHHICLMASAPAGPPPQQEHQVVEHRPEPLTEWVAGLRQRFGGRRVAVCLEQSRGALIHALMGHEFLVLYPVNPKTLARYREAFAPSQAKDDPTDAALLLDLLLKHLDKLRAWKPDDELTRTLALLVEGRRQAVDLRTQLSNQLSASLKGYFPQAMDWVGDKVYSALSCDLLTKWPTLDALQRAKPQALREFYYGHGCRRGDLIEERIQAIAKATPLTRDKAIVESSTLAVKMLARQLRTLGEAIEEYERRLQELFPSHPDAPLFAHLPGAGEALAPRLLTAFGTDRNRFESANQVQAYAGIAPVTERSGKSTRVHWRWACPKFIRQTFHEFAQHSMKSSSWAKSFYQMQRQKGKGHHAAVRALAFKWIRILFRCWKDRQPYVESQYLDCLRKRGAPLATFLAASH
jgi:transposase